MHQAERALAGVGTAGYHERLVRALAEAEAVLVVNPLHEAMLSPYCERVRVVTAGMDPARFPWPWPDDPAAGKEAGRVTLFYAGLPLCVKLDPDSPHTLASWQVPRPVPASVGAGAG
jgi:hypothetical protein